MSDVLGAILKLIDEEDLFRQTVERTAHDYGFPGDLIEKDVFCSLTLAALAPHLPERVVFKGGTCLSKVFSNFYRLSEDLDFAISIPADASRADRRRLMEPVKKLCGEISSRCPCLMIVEPLRGANQSMQYVQTLGYISGITGKTAQIKVEFGVREPLLMPSSMGSARTLLVSPLTGKPLLSRVPIRTMALNEMWSEKVRAALCRRESAIRDFFDLDFAMQSGQIEMDKPDFVAIVRQKLAVSGNGPIQLHHERLAELERTKETDLKPVLRARDFEEFNLDRIWTALLALTGRLKDA